MHSSHYVIEKLGEALQSAEATIERLQKENALLNATLKAASEAATQASD